MNVPFLKNLSFLLTRVIFCWSLSKCYWPSLTLVLGHDILIFLWKKISLSVTRWVKVHFKFSLFQLSSWNICSLWYILQKPCSLLHYNLGLALSTDCWPKYCTFMTYILLCGFFLLFFSLFFFFFTEAHWKMGNILSCFSRISSLLGDKLKMDWHLGRNIYFMAL